MKKIILIISLMFSPLLMAAQDKVYFLYNIVTFDGNFDKEGLKVKVDDGKSVEKLKDENGNRIRFNTPAAALMYFLSKGWEMYLTGGTSSGSSFQGTGASSTTSYWVFRKPCSKEEFEKAVEEGIKK
ncbi:MAG: hypothetical protein SPH03_07095 [Prevotella sp.]|nr:hypothetical protein [Prevotella sp.]